jgi:hypothetical protein
MGREALGAFDASAGRPRRDDLGAGWGSRELVTRCAAAGVVARERFLKEAVRPDGLRVKRGPS